MEQEAKLLWNLFDPRRTRPEQNVYSFTYGKNADLLVTKINVALAIGRPLLLTGKPGVGKTSVARAIASAKGWPLFKVSINSRTEADDLKASFDDLSRLSDANVKSAKKAELDPLERYMKPGVLWQAYNPLTALAAFEQSFRASAAPPELSAYRDADEATRGRVLLIDEIDKGDLDLANDLLDAFDRGNFTIERTGQTVRLVGQDEEIDGNAGSKGDGRLLVVITSNNVRTQSEAFQRRCLPHTISRPTLNEAVQVGHVIARNFGAPDGLLDSAGIRYLARLSEAESDKVNTAFLADLIEFVIRYSKLSASGDGQSWQSMMAGLREFADSRARAGREPIE